MLEAIFYRGESGSEPVREWIRSLPGPARKIIGGDIDLVQRGWPIGKPLVGNLGMGLWEVRSRLSDRIARIIFLIDGRRMVLLHGFIKKTQKTPPHELETARRRMKHYNRSKP